MRLSPVILALAVTAPAALHSQGIPTRILTRPDAEWAEPFSQIVGVRELKNGRVIVADDRDKVIQLITFNGEAKTIGREGSGPGEYGFPRAVFAAPGDSTWVFDLLNSRYLVIDPEGKPVSTFTMVDGGPPGPDAGSRGGAARGGGRGAFGLGFAQGIDERGRLYFRAPTIQTGGNDAASDTTPIVRWDRKTRDFDTVGVLVTPRGPTRSLPSGGGGGRGEVRATVRIGSATPFGSADAYVVMPSGDVAVVRAIDYHVDWIANGRTVSGPAIRYDRVKVTNDDKVAWAEQRKNATATMVVNDGSGRKVQNVPLSSLDEAPAFPELKGPFINAVAGPNGQVWVQKHMPAGSPPTYDVIDRGGKLASRVVLPKKTRLIGFGTGTVYVARIDDDDLQYLQRYRLTGSPR
ncbi:MAG TPA: hypothetical protein VFO55_10995 [Gemmatimonadaceae bacterium]|nr:hypothetical protein [Gemmatimonadaceae bacterium]